MAADGSELGDVEQVRRDTSGAVTALLIEVEDSKPGLYVELPLAGLRATKGGILNEADLQTNLTTQDLAVMPDAKMRTPRSSCDNTQAAKPNGLIVSGNNKNGGKDTNTYALSRLGVRQ